MTALPRHISDPDRSTIRPLQARSLPASLRVVVALAGAAALLWPLAPLAVDAASVDAWTRETWSAAWFSVWQAAVAAAAGVALSMPIGWALARVAVPGRRLLRAVLTLPVVMPAVALALGTSWLHDDAWGYLLLAHAAFGLAVGVRLGGSAWRSLDPHALEAASTFGMSWRQAARWYVAPALRRTYLAAWALSFALAVSAVGTAVLLAPVSRPALPELAGTLSEGSAGTAETAAASMVLVGIVAVATLVFVRSRPDRGEFAPSDEARPAGELGRRARVLLAAVFALALLVAVGPVVALAHATLTIGASEQVTGANVIGLFEEARPLEIGVAGALGRSGALVVVALVVGLPLGAVVAMLIAPLRGWASTLVEALLLLPLFVSVATASGLRSAGFDDPSWLVFVHAGMATALVIRAVLPGARARLGPQFEAATLLGASRWSSWQRLAGRALRVRLAVAGVLVAGWSLGEIGAALVLHRVDTAPAPVAIAQALQQQTAEADGRAVALSLLLVLIAGLLFVTIEYRRPREIAEF